MGDIMYNSALKILNIIEEKGFKAYIVGGFARDYYMKRESCDIDICTNALPVNLIEIFKDAILPKEEYGAVTIFYNNIRFEITTFRKELKYEGRRPIEIKYINDLKEDLFRRDFTINSICLDKDGNFIDYYNGLKDIDNEIIRCLGDIDLKLKEDPLRIIRAIRFATILNFKIEKSLESKIKEYGYLLKNISYDRKKCELDKILSCDNSLYGIKLLKDLNLSNYLDINLENIVITKDIIGMWSQIDIGYYNFSKNEKNIIENIRKIVSNKVINKIDIYKYGLYIVSNAAKILGIDEESVIKLDRNLVIRKRSDINITSKEIVDLLNIKPSKIINDIYIDLEDKIINNKLKNNNSEIKEYIIEKYR